ncbi:MAG: hypothetical protein LBQ30_03850 [Treponema sp.]|jgi:hypothetical protein|nr:hypothetical protein [Treponema sp.]
MKTSHGKNRWFLKGLVGFAFWGLLGTPQAVRGEDSSTPWYVPESGTAKATLGALTNEIDDFMSINTFRNVRIQDFMGYLGIDAQGLTLGYARNLGSLYIGICYGGSLMDDLYRRITNQTTDSLLKRDTEITTKTEHGDSVSTTYGIVDQEGKDVPGTVISKNDISVILGFRNYSLKVGLSQYLQGTYDPDYDPKFNERVYNPFTSAVLVEKPIGMSNQMQITREFIGGLRPYLEFGGMIYAGSFLIKPSLRLGVDLHQYSRNEPKTTFIFDYVDPTAATKTEELKYILIHNKDTLGDFMEPSAGLSVGLDFTQDPRIRTELTFDYDLAFRLYSNNKKPLMLESEDIHLLKQTAPTESLRGGSITEITKLYLQNQIIPAFKYSSDLGERLTLGVKVGIAMNVAVYQDTAVSYKQAAPDDRGDPVENNTQMFSVLPKLGLGLSFKLIPDRFAINLGVGINVLKYEDTTVVGPHPETGIQTTTVSKTLTLPSTNLGAGLTLHFNQQVTADLLVMASGLGTEVSDSLKFNFLVTMNY